MLNKLNDTYGNIWIDKSKFRVLFHRCLRPEEVDRQNSKRRGSILVKMGTQIQLERGQTLMYESNQVLEKMASLQEDLQPRNNLLGIERAVT